MINGVNEETVNQCELLGVEISDTMSWQPQCKKFANKLHSVHHSQGCSVGKLSQTYVLRVC